MSRPKKDRIDESLKSFLFLSDEEQEEWERRRKLIHMGLMALSSRGNVLVEAAPTKRPRKPKAAKRENFAQVQGAEPVPFA